MADNDSKWFYKGPDGAKAGPASLSALRAMAVDGSVSAETPVSRDGKRWQPAVSIQEIGFDCLVLQTKDGLGVLGPFAREYLDREDALRQIPADGLFFVRSGTVADAAALPSAPAGETGAALVGRVLRAEKALRAAERARAAAEAGLRAKDLEFDAERQRLNAEISSLKAEAVKASAEVESLRAEASSRADAERTALDAAARAVDFEKKTAALSKALSAAETRADAAENRAKSESERADAAENRVKSESERADAAEKRAKSESERADAAENRVKSEAERADAAEKRAKSESERADAAENRAKSESERAEQSVAALSRLRSALAALVAETPDPQNSGVSTETEEPVVVVEPARAAHSTSASSSDSLHGRPSQMAALENQLRRELSQMASSPGTAAREGLTRLFRKK